MPQIPSRLCQALPKGSYGWMLPCMQLQTKTCGLLLKAQIVLVFHNVQALCVCMSSVLTPSSLLSSGLSAPKRPQCVVSAAATTQSGEMSE